MCGITGFLSSEPAGRAAIEAMTDSLLHRGPDAHGIYQNERTTLALGHTRLSIIDLRAGANQPFHSQDGRYVIIFNGEIYNFKDLKTTLQNQHGIQFKTTSDTEVIVEAFALWGSKMVDRLDGMFAIAIADKQRDVLFLFRDRIGKKPLYYFHSPSLFAFASEIKSLLRHPIIREQVSIDQKCISYFFHLGYIPEPYTIYQQIKKFSAACKGEVRADLNLRTEPYWKIQDHLAPRPTDNNNALAHFSTLLEESVNKRLISDVPLGSFLSGGTDSSLVTAVASRQVAGALKTFNIGFKESKFDERPFARAIAKHLKTDHHEYELSEAEAAAILETYIAHFDEPFADTSAIPTMLVSKLARQNVKVVLTGDGGDELFQGYGAYTWANRLQNPFIRSFKSPLKIFLQASQNDRLQRVAGLFGPDSGNIRSHIFSQEQYFFSQWEVHNLLLKKPSAAGSFTYDDDLLSSRNMNAGEKQAVFDLLYYLKDDLLVKVDRASMYHALECRSPLLDHHIVEFAFSLPYNLKKRNGVNKWLLKQVLKTYLPDALVDHPKWGFSIPLGNWLRTQLRYLVDNFLSDQVLEQAGIVNVPYVQTLKREFLSGKNYLYHRLWVVIVLHKWWMENANHRRTEAALNPHSI